MPESKRDNLRDTGRTDADGRALMEAVTEQAPNKAGPDPHGTIDPTNTAWSELADDLSAQERDVVRAANAGEAHVSIGSRKATADEAKRLVKRAADARDARQASAKKDRDVWRGEDLTKHTLAELRALAGDEGVALPLARRKADLIAQIERARKEASL